MKMLLATVVAAGMVAFTTGCATPAYVGGLPTIKIPEERWSGEQPNRVLRAWVLDNRMMFDDIDVALLHDKPSQLTRWHIR